MVVVTCVTACVGLTSAVHPASGDRDPLNAGRAVMFSDGMIDRISYDSCERLQRRGCRLMLRSGFRGGEGAFL